MPVIGLLSSDSAAVDVFRVAAFREGLAQIGYREGENCRFEYRSADGHDDRLPTLAGQLAKYPVTLLATLGGSGTALAAHAATSSVPIVFLIGGDPVKLGLVASLNQPGGNITGVTFISTVVAAKQLELVTETFPNARSVGVMVNPNSPNAASQIEDLQVAAAILHKELFVAKAASETDLERAFSALAQARVGAAIVLADTLFTNRPDHLVTLGC